MYLYLILVCKHETGFCNVFGLKNCIKNGCNCKFGYSGDRCDSCSSGFYISNSKENGTIGNTAEGVKCEGKENVIRFTNLFSYIIISHYHIT